MKQTTAKIPLRRAGGPMEPSGQVWPNGEFTIGYAPCGGMERELSAKEYADKGVPLIDLTLASNSHTEKDWALAPRGTGGLTSYGRRLIRNCVEHLEKRYGTRNLSFVTLTLPELEYEEFWNVSSNWAEICRVFYQALCRKLESVGLPGLYAGVTELQPKRTERTEVPCLHLHFVCVGRLSGRKSWGLAPGEFRELWSRTVSRYCWGRYDWSSSENVQAVQYSAAGYLSKYLSKGCPNIDPICREGTGWSLPTAWYNAAIVLKRKIIEGIRTDPRLIESIELAAREGQLEQGCEYLYAGTVDEMAGTGPHYFVGKLKPKVMEFFVELWKNSA